MAEKTVFGYTDIVKAVEPANKTVNFVNTKGVYFFMASLSLKNITNVYPNGFQAV